MPGKTFKKVYNEINAKKSNRSIKEDYIVYEEINTEMEKHRYEFQKMAKQSEIEAKNIILTGSNYIWR